MLQHPDTHTKPLNHKSGDSWVVLFAAVKLTLSSTRPARDNHSELNTAGRQQLRDGKHSRHNPKIIGTEGIESDCKLCKYDGEYDNNAQDDDNNGGNNRRDEKT